MDIDQDNVPKLVAVTPQQVQAAKNAIEIIQLAIHPGLTKNQIDSIQSVLATIGKPQDINKALSKEDSRGQE
jgi:hypothetical protein